MSPRVRATTSNTVTEQQLHRAYERGIWALNDQAPSIAAVARAAAAQPRAAASMLDRRRKRGDGDGYRALLAGDDLFTYLLLHEIEREEIRQERAGYRLSQGDLTKRFVKHPIKFAMNHNGFYAAAGLCFGLSAYTGNEAIQQFQAVAPDAVVKGERECSRARRRLAEGLLARFGNVALTEPCASLKHDGMRLARMAPSPGCLAIMKQGLEIYRPSGARHVIPAGYRRGDPLSFSTDKDRAELERMHVFFDLQCHDRLTNGLHLDPFEVRARTLVLRPDPPPAYFASASDGAHGFPLTQIRTLIDEEEQRAQNVSPGSLRVRVDGITRAFIDRLDHSVAMVLEEDASVVEIVGDCDGVEAVLGTYVLTYDGAKTERWDVALPWSDSERIACTFDYVEDNCVNALFERGRVRSVVPRPHFISQPPQLFSPFDLLEPGREVFGYKILACGSRGKTSIADSLYKALHPSRGVVALKLLATTHPDVDHHTSPLRGCLETGLRHPHIGATYELLRLDDRTPVVVREFVDGITMEERLDRGPIPPSDALGYLDQMLGALDCLHRHEIVHRDLKPSNVLLQPNDTVKIVDFGIAKRWAESAPNAPGLPDHVIPYLAPEQMTFGHADPRSDVFSCGVVAYEMLTGQRLWLDRSTGGERAPVIPPIEINSTLPKDLNDVVLKAVEPDPRARFQSAEAFRRALARCGPSTARSTQAANRRDRVLVSAFREGDTAAAESLYRRYHEYVRGQALRCGVERSECSDLANLVFADVMFHRQDSGGSADLPIRLWNITRRKASQTSRARLAVLADRTVSAQADAVQDYLTCARRRYFADSHCLDDASRQSAGVGRVSRLLIGSMGLVALAVVVAAVFSGFDASALGGIGTTSLCAGLAVLREKRLARRQREAIDRYRALEETLTSLREAFDHRTASDDGVGVVHLPQDWRQVVPLARKLALDHRRRDRDPDVEQRLATAESRLPSLALRPSLRATLDALLKDP